MSHRVYASKFLRPTFHEGMSVIAARQDQSPYFNSFTPMLQMSK
ncbi:hypothetical protein [Metabacillus idriensis]|nr:hypothetical protein [Metabacillus idriensis]